MEYQKLFDCAKEFVLTFLALIAYGCDRILGIAEDPATTQALIDNALFPAVEVIRELLILALSLGLGVLILLFPVEGFMDHIFRTSDK